MGHLILVTPSSGGGDLSFVDYHHGSNGLLLAMVNLCTNAVSNIQ